MTTLRIGPFDYVFEIHHDLDDGNGRSLVGHISSQRGFVRVDDDQSDEFMLCVLLHEVGHAALDLGNCKHDERVLDTFAYTFLGFMRTNFPSGYQEMMTFIRQERERYERERRESQPAAEADPQERQEVRSGGENFPQ